jgi:probable F420-dependent oxidoreductase
VKFGIGYFSTDDGMPPGDLARMVEERGHESLFFAEHTHIPASRESEWPAGGDLPRKYWHTYDPFVTCMAAAAATTQLRIGTGICLVVERDPITTAKEVASVDRLSGGRFEFGVGAGWNREEMENHGTDPRRRMKLMEERIEAMKAIWAEDEASYHGEFVDFERIWSWPKPAQLPHPPIVVGGNGPTVIDRVLRFGDTWMPNYAPEDFESRVAELRARAERPVDFQLMSITAKAEAIQRFADLGASRVVHWVPSANRSVIEAALERWEAAIVEFTGET